MLLLQYKQNNLPLKFDFFNYFNEFFLYDLVYFNSWWAVVSFGNYGFAQFNLYYVYLQNHNYF